MAEYGKYYRIQVAEDSGFLTILWDSGQVLFSEYPPGVSNHTLCSGIIYAGSALTMGDTYYWRAKCWDDEDAEGDWSVPASFTLTLEPTHFTYIGGDMVATTTVDGHIQRAIDFQARTDIYAAAGRTTPWDQAQLLGTMHSPFDTSVDTTITIIMDELPAIERTVAATFTPSATYPVSSVVNDINDAWVAAGGTGTIASAGGALSDQVLIQSQITGDGGRVYISIGNDKIGLATGAEQTASSLDPPAVDPAMHQVEELIALKKADAVYLVVPDEDTAATMLSPNAGSPGYDTITNPTLTFVVDGTVTVDVSFIGELNRTPANIVNDINTRYQTVTLSTDIVATVDGFQVRLTSNTLGATSSLTITGENLALGWTVGMDAYGHDGGSIYYRDTQWRIVLPVDAYDEGARWVYLEANLNYDIFPLVDYRQIGWYVGLVPGWTPPPPLPDPMLPDQVPAHYLSPGILNVVDNRREGIFRAIDMKEKLSVVIEF